MAGGYGEGAEPKEMSDASYGAEQARTPDGKTAYVANNNAGAGNTVTPIDTATNTAGPAITVGTGPRAIVISPDGQTAYVANGANASVTPITIATNKPGAGIKVGGGPVFLAIKP